MFFGTLGVPGFHLVQSGLETLAHPPQHAGEVRVVESNHPCRRSTAWPSSNSSTLFLQSCPRRSPASGPRSGPGACTAWPPRSRRAAGALPRWPRRVADPLPVLPAITRQPGFFWFVVRDSCVERLFVCTSASSLIMISSHWCVPPSGSRKTRALWLPSSRSSGPLSGAALLLDTCSLLQPAQFFVKKRSSEKSEVLVTVSVLEAKSCGADRARARHVAAHHAARRHSAARGREGAVQALAVQRARGGRPGDCQRGARERTGGCEACRGCCARGRQRARGHVAHRGKVPVGRVVDGECAARDSCGGAQQAHAGRAAMLSELPDTAPWTTARPRRRCLWL